MMLVFYHVTLEPIAGGSVGTIFSLHSDDVVVA